MTHTNRQVTNTDPSARMQSAADFAISFDWLEFTICDSSLTAVFEQVLQLPAGQFMHTGPGNYGYRDKHVHVHNKICGGAVRRHCRTGHSCAVIRSGLRLFAEPSAGAAADSQRIAGQRPLYPGGLGSGR